MHLILEGKNSFNKGDLWLGNIKAAKNMALLQEKNIKFVLTIADNIKLEYPETLGISNKVVSS
jgi:hypothetical protein